MHEKNKEDALALERTLLAAERTFSAWIRTGLAGLGGGVVVAQALVFEDESHQWLARVIGALLVLWAGCVFVYAAVGYHCNVRRLSPNGQARGAFVSISVIAGGLFFILVLVFWLTLH